MSDVAEKVTLSQAGALLEKAAAFYEQALDSNDSAKKYLLMRGVSEASIKKHRIGYAPRGVGPLLTATQATPADLLSVKLLSRRDDDRLQPFLSHRITFPIRDADGNVCGFGGRLLETTNTKAPKYKNSAASSFFNKSETLYGLEQLDKEPGKHRRLIFVEGYLDVVALSQAGITTPVAGLGTAFTSGHAEIVKESADEVVFMYDDDNAGRKATLDALSTLIENGFSPAHIRVLSLHDEMDPDEFIMSYGPSYTLELIETAPLSVEWLLQRLDSLPKNSPTDVRIRYGDAFLLWVNRVQHPEYQKQLLQKLAEYLEVQPVDLAQWYERSRDALTKNVAIRP